MNSQQVASGEIIFHLAFPVTNIPETKRFYGNGLGCEMGRESDVSLIMNLYGHQIVAQVTREDLKPQAGIYPRHFGLVFREKTDWDALLLRAQAQKLTFRIEPKLRFEDSALEHSTFFLEDPFYNLLEFKVYRHPAAIFGAQEMAMVGDR